MFARIWRRGWRLLMATWKGWQEDNGGTLSAAIAYYGVFSLFPLCLVLVAGVGFVARYSKFVQQEQQRLITHVGKNIGPWLADQLTSVLNGIQTQASLGGIAGLLMLVLAAIGIFMQLDNVFARVWRVPPPAGGGWLAGVRELLWSRLLAFLTLLAIGIMLAAVFVADVVLASIQTYVTHLPAGPFAWKAVQTVVTIVCDTTLLATVYWVVPRTHVPWRAAFAGGLLAAVLWTIGRWLLLLLVVGKEYSAYGILGVLMGIMLWYYFASIVIFLGAEFAHALSEDRGTP